MYKELESLRVHTIQDHSTAQHRAGEGRAGETHISQHSSVWRGWSSYRDMICFNDFVVVLIIMHVLLLEVIC